MTTPIKLIFTNLLSTGDLIIYNLSQGSVSNMFGMFSSRGDFEYICGGDYCGCTLNALPSSKTITVAGEYGLFEFIIDLENYTVTSLGTVSAITCMVNGGGGTISIIVMGPN